jgi:hypothetical protein
MASLPNGRQSILFVRTSLVGAEPAGFYNRLATAYDAQIASAQKKYTAEGGLDKRPGSEQRRQFYSAVEHETRQMLLHGVNVVFDTRLNLRRVRNTIRTRVAEAAGAQTILLCVQSPIELMHERLAEKASDAYPFDPIHQRKDRNRLMGVLHSMQNHMEWPGQDEPHLALDGQLPVEMLIEQTQKYVATQLAAGTAEGPA